MRAAIMAALLSFLLIPAGAFAGSIKVSSHKGKTTVRVHSKGKPVKMKTKSW